LHFQRLDAADEGHRAPDRVAPDEAIQVVGQGVVDQGFDVAIKGQHALASLVAHAVVHVVGQHLRIPPGKGLLVAEMLQRGFAIGQLLRRPG
jgi:hypothetical protein